jgi:hypothetical protein
MEYLCFIFKTTELQQILIMESTSRFHQIRHIIALRRLMRLRVLSDYLTPSSITRVLAVCYLTRRDADIDITSSKGKELMSIERELLDDTSELHNYRDRGFEILFIGHDIPLLKEYIWNSTIVLRQQLSIWIAISYPRYSGIQYCETKRSFIPGDFGLCETRFAELSIPWLCCDEYGSEGDNVYMTGDIYHSTVSLSPPIDLIYIPQQVHRDEVRMNSLRYPCVNIRRGNLDNVTKCILSPTNFHIPYLKFKDCSWTIFNAQYKDDVIHPMNYSMKCHIKIPGVSGVAIVYFEF